MTETSEADADEMRRRLHVVRVNAEAIAQSIRGSIDDPHSVLDLATLADGVAALAKVAEVARDSLRGEVERLREWLMQYPVALCTNFADHDAHLFDGANGRAYLCRGVRAALAVQPA